MKIGGDFRCSTSKGCVTGDLESTVNASWIDGEIGTGGVLKTSVDESKLSTRAAYLLVEKKILDLLSPALGHDEINDVEDSFNLLGVLRRDMFGFYLYIKTLSFYER